MSELVHLIEVEEIPERTAAQPNSDKHKLKLGIHLAESKHLRKLLGVALYSELMLSVQTGSGEDMALAKLASSEELKNMLCQWALVEAWPSLLVHITEAGLTVKNGKDVSTSADANQTEAALEGHINTATFFSSELTAWMIEHKADYPSYRPPTVAAYSTMPVGGIDLD